jgi:hypothetical protein
VTDCFEEYVPAGGENTGVATTASGTMLKAANATELVLSPIATPIAFSVSVELTVMA